jgi:H+/Cl- antiporter ClcA
MEMTSHKIVRTLWYIGAALSVIALLLFLNKSLELVWRSAFTHADVQHLRFWFYIYLTLSAVAVAGLVLCIWKGNALGKKDTSKRSPD